MRALFLIISVVFILTSCSDNPVNPSGRYYEIPSTVGSYWKYAVRDTLSNERDTVEVTIVSSATYNGNKETIWIFNSLYTIDTIKVTFWEDTMYCVLSSFAQKYFFILLSPIILNDSYDTEYGPVYVIGNVNVYLKKFTFINCYSIYKPLENEEAVDNYMYWIKPGIGIVKAQRSYNAKIGSQHQEVIWELLQYNVIRQTKIR